MTLPIRNKSRIFIIKIQSGILYNIPLFRDSVGTQTYLDYQSLMSLFVTQWTAVAKYNLHFNLSILREHPFAPSY